MASVQKGITGFGVVWSLGTTITATGIGTNQLQSVDYGLESDVKELKGADAATKCIIFSDTKENMTIEVIPSGATIALAKAANVIPAIGADVTIVDADDAEIAGSPGATTRWHFLSGTKRKTVDGEVRLTFVLRRYETDLVTIA